MMLLFRTRLGKMLILKKFSGTWESDFNLMHWILKYLNKLPILYQILTLFTHFNGSLIDQILIRKIKVLCTTQILMCTCQAMISCELSLSQTKILKIHSISCYSVKEWNFLFVYAWIYFMMTVNHLLVTEFDNNLFTPNFFVIIFSKLFWDNWIQEKTRNLLYLFCRFVEIVLKMDEVNLSKKK